MTAEQSQDITERCDATYPLWAMVIRTIRVIISWPAVIALILFVFRADIRAMLSRVEIVKVPGGVEMALAKNEAAAAKEAAMLATKELAAFQETVSQKYAGHLNKNLNGDFFITLERIQQNVLRSAESTAKTKSLLDDYSDKYYNSLEEASLTKTPTPPTPPAAATHVVSIIGLALSVFGATGLSIWFRRKEVWVSVGLGVLAVGSLCQLLALAIH